MKTIFLRVLGIIGVLIYLPLFILTFSNPYTIEKSATTFIKWELQKSVEQKIDNFHLSDSKLVDKFLKSRANSMLKKSKAKLLAFKVALKNKVPELIASQIAKVRNLDCECRKKWRDYLNEKFRLKILSLESAKEKLSHFIQAKYMDILTKLITDLKIFFGTNLSIFILILLISFFKPRAINQLFLPTVLIFIATLIVSFFYIFEQNWLYTIIYNDYVGFGYLAYLFVVFLLLYDIVFNKARVTTEILNLFLQALGNAPIVPC